MRRTFLDPFTDLHHFFEDAHVAGMRLFADATDVGQNPTGSVRQWFCRPRTDIHENKETNTVTASLELPGLTREDITIDVHPNHLTVSGEFNKTVIRDEAGYMVRECRQGKFSRAIPIPSGTKPSDVNAKMENGLLTIVFPRAAPQQQPHRITIS